MGGVTIAEVSAMINGAIVLAQLTLPLAIVLVIVGLLKNRETAATWTVVARSIQSSFWPTILRSDYSQSHGVRSWVAILSWMATVSSILLIVVGISTPLGLSDQLQLAEDQVVSSKYAPDLGPMGLATPKRITYEYSRLCGVGVPSNCPSVDDGYQTWENISNPSTTKEWIESYTTFNKSKHIVNLRIPQNVTEVFTSATANTTVSSIFDIQYRSYKHDSTAYESDENSLQNNSLYTVGTMRTLQSLILNNKIELIEGLVVDTMNGGIGFRNHTIPVQTEFGSVWQEDLLWMELVTECVNTNLTIEFESLLHSTDSLRSEQSLLVDNGGIVNLSPDYPFIDQNDTQEDPQLRATAYRAAAFNNALAAAFYNLTEGRKHYGEAHLGAKYNLTSSEEPYPQYLPGLYEIGIGGVSGLYLPLPNKIYNGTGDVTAENWTMVDVGTRRYGGLDVVNMSTVGMQVGMIMGAPYLTDGSNPLILEPKMNWTQTMMTCASATRASIKTVKFTTNGTSLEDVNVIQVSDKIYPDEASLPLWAIERTNLTINKYSPLWGLIDYKHEHSEALQTRRNQHLWLPAGQLSSSSIYDSTPAGAHLLALSAAYDIGTGLDSGPFLADYTGKKDFAMYVRWVDLSRSSKTAGKIINLIWTDIMANLVVGTKPGLSSSDKTLGGPSYDRVIRPWKRHVVYDLRYAIPAIVFLALWLCVLLGALLLTFLSRISLSALTQLMNQLAPGRMAANFLHSDACRLDAPTKEWAANAGSLSIGFERDRKGQVDGDGATATPQRSRSEKTRDLTREDVLRMVGVDDRGDRGTVPISVVLAPQREKPSSGPAQAPQKKSDPESSSLIQVTALSESEPGTKRQS